MIYQMLTPQSTKTAGETPFYLLFLTSPHMRDTLQTSPFSLFG